MVCSLFWIKRVTGFKDSKLRAAANLFGCTASFSHLRQVQRPYPFLERRGGCADAELLQSRFEQPRRGFRVGSQFAAHAGFDACAPPRASWRRSVSRPRSDGSQMRHARISPVCAMTYWVRSLVPMLKKPAPPRPAGRRPRPRRGFRLRPARFRDCKRLFPRPAPPCTPHGGGPAELP